MKTETLKTAIHNFLVEILAIAVMSTFKSNSPLDNYTQSITAAETLRTTIESNSFVVDPNLKTNLDNYISVGNNLITKIRSVCMLYADNPAKNFEQLTTEYSELQQLMAQFPELEEQLLESCRTFKA